MDKIEDLLKSRAEIDLQLEKMRTPITILFSDIRGSTAFFEAQGDVQGLAMVENHNRLLFPIIERNEGRIVKTIGDAIMASFNKPANALRAAIGMQQALVRHNQDRGPSQQIHIRIGVHSGLGLVKNGDIYGDVVNTASRVETHSEPDQIYISAELVETAQSLGVSCVSAGFAELKGKAETVELHKLDWSGYVEKIPAAAGHSRSSRTVSWIIAAAILLVFLAGTFMRLRQSAPAPTVTSSQLNDLIMRSPVAGPLLVKVGKTSVRGFHGDGDENPITRAELAFVLEDLVAAGTGNGGLANQYIGADTSPFTDVGTTHPAFNAVMTATSRKLLQPRTANRFAPAEPVTGAEIESALERLQASIPQR